MDLVPQAVGLITSLSYISILRDYVCQTDYHPIDHYQSISAGASLYIPFPSENENLNLEASSLSLKGYSLEYPWERHFRTDT